MDWKDTKPVTLVWENENWSCWGDQSQRRVTIRIQSSGFPMEVLVHHICPSAKVEELRFAIFLL